MAPFEFAWPPFEQSASSGTSAYDQQTRGIPRSGTPLPPDGGSGKEPLGQRALATACCRLDGNGIDARAIWHRPNQERSREGIQDRRQVCPSDAAPTNVKGV